MKLKVSFRENNTVFGNVLSEMQAVTIIDSPHFTGIPTAPTAPAGTNDEQIATTEFVTRAISQRHTGYGNIVTLSVSEVIS